ncbi:MAG TPA: hypothetical protein VFQ60_04535 [Patescibacteria group bacterium]|nr:hypothetical protein [Patescibacteria group bacterium]
MSVKKRISWREIIPPEDMGTFNLFGLFVIGMMLAEFFTWLVMESDEYLFRFALWLISPWVALALLLTSTKAALMWRRARREGNLALKRITATIFWVSLNVLTAYEIYHYIWWKLLVQASIPTVIYDTYYFNH